MQEDSTLPERLPGSVDDYTLRLVQNACDKSKLARKVSLERDLDDVQVFLSAASLRDEDATTIEVRSTTTIGGPSGIPLLILDEVMDLFREQRILEAFKRNWRGACVMKFQHHEERSNPGCGTITIRRTLANCALVHSSWSRRAESALGGVLVIRNETRSCTLPQMVCNPCVGVWTREIYITLDWSSRPHYAYSALFARTPNTEFLHLNVESVVELKPVCPELCQAISKYLRNLRELVFEVLWPTPIDDMRYLLEFPEEIPALKVVHFVGVDVGDVLYREPGFLFPLPTSISHVSSIHAHEKNKIAIGFFDVVHVSWSRQISDEDEEVTNVTFAVDSMSCTSLDDTNYGTDFIPGEGRELIPQVKEMQYICGMNCRSNCITDVLVDAQRLTKLHIVMFEDEIPTFFALVDGMRSLPPGMNEILITFTPIQCKEGPAELWDNRACELLAALEQQHTKRLKSFESQIGPIFHEPGSDEDRCPWSLKTKQWCQDKRIIFIQRHRGDRADHWCSFTMQFDD
ncbi:hypothetical protein SCHPADRAFT_934422 [Schizopora paradoxa]|uniref:Uncharacterized protein n=1 Tax=Schizopora paradoxa TaxID=27342 RepID=A0A0H2STY7_9AGAM|nr:hypothetical protein SCHPADRAFT_934422 [Schizopora paradoxa]